jgi:hypothetical protein
MKYTQPVSVTTTGGPSPSPLVSVRTTTPVAEEYTRSPAPRLDTAMNVAGNRPSVAAVGEAVDTAAVANGADEVGVVADVAAGVGDDTATRGKGVPVIETAEADRTGDNSGLAVGDSPAAHAEAVNTTKLTAVAVKRQLIGGLLYAQRRRSRTIRSD